jgi:sialidase-1
MAVETVDKNVYLTMRNVFGKNRRALAISNDGGLTWGPVSIEDQLVSPTCQASIVRLSTTDNSDKNRILFMNPASEKRENMSIRVSYDEGATWGKPKVVHANAAAYSDLAVLEEQKKIIAIYENGKRWPYTKITFVSMDLDWITNEDDSLGE